MAQFDSPILTSQLEGLVRDDNGYVMGLVLSYIDCAGATLNCVDGHDPKFSDLRQKWVNQISQTLEKLHSHNIIWGDAKAANVLVDVNEDAYLIDFGGGYTEGWVEKEKSNSMDGDLQGLENIKRYLFE
jgi:serine/threonine protein kinase